MKEIRILLADDHTVIRKGLRLLLESQSGFKVIAEAADGRETVELAEAHVPHVVVLDVAMPNLNGIEAARQISAKVPQTAIVFLSMHSDESYVLRALKAGARAYLLKDSAEYDLINAIRAVTEGKTNKEVATILNLSLYTVETHRSNMLQKLNLHSVPELILYAVRKGVIS